MRRIYIRCTLNQPVREVEFVFRGGHVGDRLSTVLYALRQISDDPTRVEVEEERSA